MCLVVVYVQLCTLKVLSKLISQTDVTDMWIDPGRDAGGSLKAEQPASCLCLVVKMMMCLAALVLTCEALKDPLHSRTH